MSILVHPDKNQDDKERAQVSFEGWVTLFYSPHIPPFCSLLMIYLFRTV